jgi:uncharacterized protein
VLLILEIGLLLVGLIILVQGKLSLTKNRVVEGTTARWVGLLLVLVSPVAYLFGYVFGKTLRGPVDLGEAKLILTVMELCIVITLVGMAGAMAWTSSRLVSEPEQEPEVELTEQFSATPLTGIPHTIPAEQAAAIQAKSRPAGSLAAAPLNTDEPALETLPPSLPQPGFWAAVLWCLAILLLTQLLPGLLAGLLLAIGGEGSITRGELRNSQALIRSTGYALVMMFVMPLSQGLSIYMAWKAIKWKVGPNWKRELNLRRPSWFHVALAFTALPAFMLVGVAVDGLAQQVLPSFVDLGSLAGLFGRWPMAVGVLVIGFGPGIGEELWFRGFIGRGLLGRYGVGVGVLLTSLLFGLLHLEPRQVASAMVLGVLLHLSYLASRSLVVPMLLHTANNSMSILSLHVPVLRGVDIDADEIPLIVYGLGLLSLAAAGWAFYQSRVVWLAADPARVEDAVADTTNTAFSPRRLPRTAWVMAIVSAVVLVEAAVLLAVVRPTSPERWFFIAFPTTPRHTTRPEANGPRTLHEFTVQQSDTTFSVTTFDRPKAGPPRSQLQIISDLQEQAWGEVVPEKPVTLGTYNGWEFMIRMQTRMRYVRVYQGHGREYILSVTGPFITDVHTDAYNFFNSFRLFDAGVPEPPPPRNSAAVQPPDKLFKGWESELISVAFAKDGKSLIAASMNGEFTDWEVASTQRLQIRSWPRGRVSLRMGTHGPDRPTRDPKKPFWRIAAVVGLNGDAHFMDLDPGMQEPGIISTHDLPRKTVSATCSPDGMWIATAHTDNAVWVWELTEERWQSIRLVKELKSKDRVQSLVFIPIKGMLAVGSPGNTVTLWDRHTGTPGPVLKGSGAEGAAGSVVALACSPDGKMLAAGGDDQTVRLWELERQKESAILKHSGTVRSVAFSGNSRLLATGDDLGNIAVWDTTLGTRSAFIPADNAAASIRALAFSPDDSLLAAAIGLEIRLWELGKVRWEAKPTWLKAD